MNIVLLVVASRSGRDRLRGPVNLTCPQCTRIAAPAEGALVPWCGWCASWLCSRHCARQHECQARRAAHALLDQLVAAA
jgi:hypothetical protein